MPGLASPAAPGLTLGSWPGAEADHNRFLQILLGALAAEGLRIVSFRESRDIRLGGLDALLVHWPDKVFWEASRSLQAAALMARLLTRLAARPRRTKLVWMVHDLAPHDGKWFKRLAWPPYAAQMARLADGALALSEGTRAAVLAAYPALAGKPVEHIWHPAYPGEALPPEARATARAGLGWSEEERVYGYCGQLRPYKGVEDLIRAFRDLPDAGARLLVAGRPRDAAFAAALGVLAGEDARIRLLPEESRAGAVPRLPRRLRHRGGAVPPIPPLGLGGACPERATAGPDPGDAVRDQPRGRARPPRLAPNLSGTAHRRGARRRPDPGRRPGPRPPGTAGRSPAPRRVPGAAGRRPAVLKATRPRLVSEARAASCRSGRIAYEVIWLLGSYQVFQAVAAGPTFGYSPRTITPWKRSWHPTFVPE